MVEVPSPSHLDLGPRSPRDLGPRPYPLLFGAQATHTPIPAKAHWGSMTPSPELLSPGLCSLEPLAGASSPIAASQDSGHTPYP